MTEELKPCPFCGGEADFDHFGNQRMPTVISCTDCGARLKSRWDRGQGLAWNQRTPPKVKELVWDELRQHKLGSGPYELACNNSPVDPDAMWRVKFHEKVICKRIKGVDRAAEWANTHNKRRILACLEGYHD